MILFEKLLAKDANTYIRFSDENVETFCANFDKNKDGNVMDDIMGGIGNLFGGNK